MKEKYYRCIERPGYGDTMTVIKTGNPVEAVSAAQAAYKLDCYREWAAGKCEMYTETDLEAMKA